MRPQPKDITWKGKPAKQLTGWQAAANGNPGRATAIIRINGRKLVAYAADVRTV